VVAQLIVSIHREKRTTCGEIFHIHMHERLDQGTPPAVKEKKETNQFNSVLSCSRNSKRNQRARSR